MYFWVEIGALPAVKIGRTGVKNTGVKQVSLLLFTFERFQFMTPDYPEDFHIQREHSVNKPLTYARRVS